MLVDPAASPQLYAATFVATFLSGLVPVVNAEAYLVGVIALAKGGAPLPLAFVSAAGQMAAKSLLYLSGRGILRLPLRRHTARLEDLRQRVGHSPQAIAVFMFLSALTGIPPFYLVSVLAGTLRWSFASFLAVGFFGRFVRFAVVAGIPEIVLNLVR